MSNYGKSSKIIGVHVYVVVVFQWVGKRTNRSTLKTLLKTLLKIFLQILGVVLNVLNVLHLKFVKRSQQATFFCYVKRRIKLEDHFTSVKVEGARAIGRLREITDSMARWLEMIRAVEIIRKVEDRNG